MPTTRTDSTALPSVRTAGSRPAWNQMAAVMSMLFALDSRTSTSCPAPVNTPAPASTATRHQAGDLAAASSRSIPAPDQTVC